MAGQAQRHHATRTTSTPTPTWPPAPWCSTRDRPWAPRTRGLGDRHQAWLFVPMLTLEALNLHVSSVLARPATRPAVSPARGGAARRPCPAYLRLISSRCLAAGADVGRCSTRRCSASTWVARSRPTTRACRSSRPNGRRPPAPPGADLAQRARRPVTEALMGGLNYQIEHHLFPSMPRPNLRRAQRVVQRFCEDRGVRLCRGESCRDVRRGGSAPGRSRRRPPPELTRTTPRACRRARAPARAGFLDPPPSAVELLALTEAASAGLDRCFERQHQVLGVVPTELVQGGIRHVASRTDTHEPVVARPVAMEGRDAEVRLDTADHQVLDQVADGDPGPPGAGRDIIRGGAGGRGGLRRSMTAGGAVRRGFQGSSSREVGERT